MAYFTLFEYTYQNIADIFYVVINWLVVGLMARSSWKQHLKWAVPTAIDTSLQLCYRIIKDLHYFGGFGTAMQTFQISQTFWYTGSIIGLYATWMFYVAVKQSLHSAAGKDLFTQPPAMPDPSVWPPPPHVSP